MLLKLVPGGYSDLIIQNNQNSNWKKLLGFRNIHEKLEKDIYSLLRLIFGFMKKQQFINFLQVRKHKFGNKLEFKNALAPFWVQRSSQPFLLNVSYAWRRIFFIINQEHPVSCFPFCNGKSDAGRPTLPTCLLCKLAGFVSCVELRPCNNR